MADRSDIHDRLAASLRAARKARGLSLDAAARLSGVSRSMVSQIERGESSPTVATLWNLTQALQVDFAGLLEGKPEPGIVVIRAAAAPVTAAGTSSSPSTATSHLLQQQQQQSQSQSQAQAQAAGAGQRSVIYGYDPAASARNGSTVHRSGSGVSTLNHLFSKRLVGPGAL